MHRIDSNISEWFWYKGVTRPSRTVLAVDLLATDSLTNEVGAVVVTSDQLTAAPAVTSTHQKDNEVADAVFQEDMDTDRWTPYSESFHDWVRPTVAKPASIPADLVSEPSEGN